MSTRMSTHQPQASTSTSLGSLRPQTPVASSHFLTTTGAEPESFLGGSQQPPETPLRPTTSRTLYDVQVQTPERTRPQAPSVAIPTLQSPFHLPSPQHSHPLPSPRATLALQIPQRGARSTHSPFVIHRNPDFRPQPRPRSRALALPLQTPPLFLDSSRVSFHTPSYAQSPDESMAHVHLPRLTHSPSTLQSPVAVTPGQHEALLFTIPGSGMSWSSGAPQTPSTP